jgi:hypothetical protein
MEQDTQTVTIEHHPRHKNRRVISSAPILGQKERKWQMIDMTSISGYYTFLAMQFIAPEDGIDVARHALIWIDRIRGRRR